MPSRRKDGSLVFRICLYGPPLAGKKTILNLLRNNANEDIKEDIKKGIFFLEQRASKAPNVIFETYTTVREVSFQKMSIMKNTDAVLFIWDSLIDKWGENVRSLKELLRFYGDKLIPPSAFDPPEVPCVVLANKRDLEDIVEISKIRQVLDTAKLNHCLIYETIAITEINVKRAFVYAARQAVLDHFKKLSGKALEIQDSSTTKVVSTKEFNSQEHKLIKEKTQTAIPQNIERNNKTAKDPIIEIQNRIKNWFDEILSTTTSTFSSSFSSTSSVTTNSTSTIPFKKDKDLEMIYQKIEKAEKFKYQKNIYQGIQILREAFEMSKELKDSQEKKEVQKRINGLINDLTCCKIIDLKINEAEDFVMDEKITEAIQLFNEILKKSEEIESSLEKKKIQEEVMKKKNELEAHLFEKEQLEQRRKEKERMIKEKQEREKLEKEPYKEKKIEAKSDSSLIICKRCGKEFKKERLGKCPNCGLYLDASGLLLSLNVLIFSKYDKLLLTKMIKADRHPYIKAEILIEDVQKALRRAYDTIFSDLKESPRIIVPIFIEMITDDDGYVMRNFFNLTSYDISSVKSFDINRDLSYYHDMEDDVFYKEIGNVNFGEFLIVANTDDEELIFKDMKGDLLEIHFEDFIAADVNYLIKKLPRNIYFKYIM